MSHHSELDVREVLDEILDIVIDFPQASQHAIKIIVDGSKKDVTVTAIEGDAGGITIWGLSR